MSPCAGGRGGGGGDAFVSKNYPNKTKMKSFKHTFKQINIKQKRGKEAIWFPPITKMHKLTDGKNI